MQVDTIYNQRGGVRYETTGPGQPVPGVSRFIDQFGDEVVFDEIGLAGMWACTNVTTQIQSLCHPQSLKPVAAARPT